MKVAGQHELPFSRTEVWEALMDPALLSRTLPGCDELVADGENAWKGTMRVQVGPVRGVFKGRLALSGIEPPHGYRMHLDGQGPTGFMDGEGTIRLEDAGYGTRLSYDLDFQVGGRIAGVGQRVLDSSARAVARQGLEGLEREMATAREAGGEDASATAVDDGPAAPGRAARPDDAAPARSAPERPSTRAAEAPSQAEMAARIARDVAADLVPPEARGWLAAGFLFFLGLAIGRWWRDRG